VLGEITTKHSQDTAAHHRLVECFEVCTTLLPILEAKASPAFLQAFSRVQTMLGKSKATLATSSQQATSEVMSTIQWLHSSPKGSLPEDVYKCLKQCMDSLRQTHVDEAEVWVRLGLAALLHEQYSCAAECSAQALAGPHIPSSDGAAASTSFHCLRHNFCGR
jgi:hypothetical protein